MADDGDDLVAITYTCGLGDNGRLGHAVLQRPTSFDKPVQDLIDVVPTSLACGENHSILLTESGKAYVWGSNSHGQLGVGTSGPRASEWQPTAVSMLDGVKVTDAAAGQSFTTFVSDDAEVFTCGDGTFGQLGHGQFVHQSWPTLIETLRGVDVVGVGAGATHAFCITGTGRVLGWGNNSTGQLGIGQNSIPSKDERNESNTMIGHSVVTLPVPVVALTKSNIIQACGGLDFSVFMSKGGKVYTCGNGARGQLGVGFQAADALSNWVSMLPMEVKMSRHKADSISCGESHVLASCNQGVFIQSWGYGGHYALGHGDTADSHAPRPIMTLRELPARVVDTACGATHSLALMEFTTDVKDENGAVMTAAGTTQLYVWGTNFAAQLGLPDSVGAIVEVPRKVLVGSTNDFSVNLRGIAAGRAFSIVTCTTSRSKNMAKALYIADTENAEVQQKRPNA